MKTRKQTVKTWMNIHIGNRKVKCYSYLLILSLFVINGLQAQVTIGSQIDPVAGALLDLKEGSSTNAVTAKKGLSMPRVELTDKNNLYPMFETSPGSGTANSSYDNATKKAEEDSRHIGLSVYHTGKCTLNGKGLYVWDGSEWQPLHNPLSIGLNFSVDDIFVPSGQDLRTLDASGYAFDVSWAPNATGIAAPTWVYTAGSYSLLTPTSLTPTSGSLSATSPQTMTLVVPAMTAAEVSSNPFITRDRKVEFTFSECNEKKSITLNQTNKALLVDGSATPPAKDYTASTTNEQLTITSNAPWKLSVTPALNSAVNTLVPAQGTVQGKDLNNNSFETVIQKYDITTGSGLQRYNYLIFSDTETPKRFADVSLTITQCGSDQEMTMEQWKDLWEEVYGTIDGVDEPDGNGDASLNTRQVQWHYDQNGNIFFSADFGAAGRWMTTNLAATDFDKRMPRTGVADPAISQNFNINASYPSPGTGNNTLIYPVYGYPNNNATTYTKRERLGLLYNWAAATNSKGGTATGEGNVDNPGVTTEGQFEEGSTSTTQKRRQGICPNGWHLPSDREWTKLENEMQTYTAKYSSDPDIGGALPTIPMPPSISTSTYPNVNKPILDMCEGTVGFGTSNSPLQGGFSLLLAGALEGSTASAFGGAACMWTSSSLLTEVAWDRLFMGVGGDTNVYRNHGERRGLFSVRCKKD